MLRRPVPLSLVINHDGPRYIRLASFLNDGMTGVVARDGEKVIARDRGKNAGCATAFFGGDRWR